jgi:hypothetical protein
MKKLAFSSQYDEDQGHWEGWGDVKIVIVG